MSISLKKIVNEIVSSIKNVSLPDDDSRTIWDSLIDQISREGKWDESVLELVKGEILQSLNKLSPGDISGLYEQTDNPFDEDMEENEEMVRENLSEEILNRILDKVDVSFEYSDSFDEETVYNDLSDYEEDDDILDLDDEEDDFGGDDDEFYYDDEEKY